MAIRLIACLLLLFGSLVNSYAQITTYQLDLKDSTISILYTGISNRIYIKNLPNNSKVKFNNEFLEPFYEQYGHYAIRVRVVDGVENTLRVFKMGKEIYNHKYVVKNTNGPLVRLGIVKDSIAAKEDILFAPRLVGFMPDCYLKFNYRLVGYNISLYRGNNVELIYKHDIDLNMVNFDDHVKNEIKLMKKGDKIVIEQIKILGRGDNGCCRDMPPIKIIIK